MEMEMDRIGVESARAPRGVTGRRLLAALAAGVAASGGLGASTWYALRWLVPSANPGGIPAQIVVAEAYSMMIASLILFFGPAPNPPLALQWTSARDVGLACLAWIGVLSTSLVVNLSLSPIFGSIPDVARKILTLATDAKRLESQPAAAWAIAVLRGCLIVPLFEELLFRGLLLDWLGRHLAKSAAIIVAAAMFAIMHVYWVVVPYAFLVGLFLGWLRERTGSTFNTLVVHVVNNGLFLCLGLWILT
jgi:membrane protease YdiL (CAAX protease family)